MCGLLLFRFRSSIMKYLFLVSIGPVQDFIASARRTRDLWFGSWLLSELSKAAAQEIVNTSTGNSLIFPAPHDENLLQPDSQLNVANKIVALIDLPPTDVAKELRKAIESRLHTIRDQQAFKDIGPLDRKAADEQIDDLVEYLWVALPYEGTNYAITRNNLEALMAARKNTRDFREVTWGSGAPKSSIDGQLESVIPEYLYRRRGELTNTQTLYYKYNAGPVERLSGVDLLKRRGNPGGEAHFFSTSHIAAMPFSKRLEQLEDPAPAKELFNKYIAKIHEIAQSQKQVAMIDRIPQRISPHPILYYAILLADGDSMGEAIDEQSKHAKGADKHREISQALDGFARNVREIVETHTGALVYAGGDDVLALMPLHMVLVCAQELTEDFAKRLAPFTNNKSKSPTLSVGIAVVHHLDSLREALDLARSA